MSASCPRVALLIETSREYGRSLLRGIMRYARLHGPWSFYLTPGDFRQALPEMVHGAGIIARVETVEVAEAILATGLPAVILDPDPRILNEVPKLKKHSVVSSDSEGAARMCAEHFLERGFQILPSSVCGIGFGRSVGADAFCGAIIDAGFQPHVYPLPETEDNFGWEREQSLLAHWIEGLPTPVGVMACNDDRGRYVLEACRLAGAHVPEEVAVIGVDNDELFCELSDPPLSSVSLNAEHGGYRTAHLLDQLMKHNTRTVQRLIVEPIEVVTRRSTDVKMIEAREVGLVMSFIHRNRSRSFTVNEVASSVGISRRNLEVKFRRATGKTILAEVQRIRLNHAQRMLRETDLPIPQIAEASGYNSPSYLTQVFRKEIGVTPAKYRTKFRV